MISRALLSAMILAVSGPSWAAGITGATTLRRPLSTRASAMAEAYSAVPGGLTSLGTNPAGLASTARPSLDTLFMSGVIDDTFGFIGWAQPMKKSAAAAGLSYYDAGKIDIRVSGGATETRTAARDFVGHLAWALSLPANASAGATVKYYRFELAQEARASGFAFDLGTQWKTPVKGLALGGAIQNLGPNVKFEQESDPLPLTWRTGLSWSWMSVPVQEDSAQTYLSGTRFVACADAIKMRGEAVLAALGAELAMDFGPTTSIALRGGMRLNTNAGSMTLGLGLREGRYRLDYALGEKSSLGHVHHAGLGVRF
ncbi:MAG: PorV/PorQ family protein [Elusimicrobiota bacterium]